MSSTKSSGNAAGVQGGAGVTVRTMTEADTLFAGSLIYEAFKQKIGNVLGEKGMKYAKDLLCSPGCLTHAQHRIFVAETEGRKAGTMLLKYHGDGETLQMHPTSDMPLLLRLKLYVLVFLGEEKVPEGKCLLEALAVTDGNRGKGIGQTMLDVADQQALKNNCKSIYLWVADGNRAKGLYERNGYATVGRHDGWLTERILGAKFTVMEKQLPS